MNDMSRFAPRDGAASVQTASPAAPPTTAPAPEAPAVQAAPAHAATAAAAATHAPGHAPAHAPAHTAARNARRRRLLLIGGPLVVLVGVGFAWLSGGRYVATDNAYVKADKLNLAADVAGFVAAVEVKEGDRVAAGQPLFRIDDTIYRITLAGAEAQLDLARNQIDTLKAQYRSNEASINQVKADVAYYRSANDRQQDLAGRGFASQNAFDQSRRDLDGAAARLAVAERQAAATLAQLGGNADVAVDDHPSVRAAKAQVDKARRDLAHTVVVAPSAGIVTNVAALQVGQYLASAQAAFSLVSTDHVWVEANPKESDLTHLKPGDAAVVTVDTYPGVTFKARVASISPATGAEFSVLPAQNTSGNWVKVVQRIPIRLDIEPTAGGPVLRAGMSAGVSVDTGHVRSVAELVDDLKHLVGA
jgi:membrane fusion protein (multidrug efflux system)